MDRKSGCTRPWPRISSTPHSRRTADPIDWHELLASLFTGRPADRVWLEPGRRIGHLRDEHGRHGRAPPDEQPGQRYEAGMVTRWEPPGVYEHARRQL